MRALKIILLIIVFAGLAVFAVSRSPTLSASFSSFYNQAYDFVLTAFGRPRPQDSTSVFEGFSEERPELNREFLENTQYSPTAAAFYEFFYSIKESPTEPDAWLNWDWQQTMIFAEIIGVSREDRTMNLDVVFPSSLGNSQEEFGVTVECAPSETAAFYASDLMYLGHDFDVFDIADETDEIYTFCANEACTVITRACVLIERVL